MDSKFQVLLRGRAKPSATLQKTYGGEESVTVLDLTTRAALYVRAHELSPYRHTLVLNGQEYQILTVIRQQ